MKLNIKHKLIILGVFALIILITSYYINTFLFWCIFVLGFFSISAIVVFFILNKWIKFTNGYKNNFIYTKQFVSNVGYRNDTQRNYEIINLGSNPARFAFFYEDVLGQNWSTGSQGLDMDFEILKYFHSYIKRGGFVLIPVVAFSSVSGYLKLEKSPLSYIAKFVSILDSNQIKIPQSLNAQRWMKYPLYYNWKSILYLITNIEQDNRLTISEQMMQPLELNKDAQYWMTHWKEEFNITDFEAPLHDDLLEGRKRSIQDLQNIINFCLERDLKPILILPPMSKFLTRLFSEKIQEIYIYSFIREANTQNIPFLNYMNDKRFEDASLYFNSFFMNLKGRKLFTKQVLHDLKALE